MTDSREVTPAKHGAASEKTVLIFYPAFRDRSSKTAVVSNIFLVSQKSQFSNPNSQSLPTSATAFQSIIWKQEL